MNFYDRINIIPDEYRQLMMNTMQEPIWHGEKDVYTHTKMVYDEVEKLELNEKDKEILRMVAIFHDIGKTETTIIENNVIRSHKHCERSYHLAMKILSNFDLDIDTRLQILNLIKYHGRPLFIYEKENPEKEVINLSLNCRLDLLYYFACCDFKGRIADDIEESLIKIEFLKMIEETKTDF